MYRLKLMEEYQFAFEQGKTEEARRLLLAHHESWTYMQARYKMLLDMEIQKTMPGCREKFIRQKEFLDNIVLEAGKNIS